MNNIVTKDLTEFGYRELDKASDLLKAYANDRNTVAFSGKVELYMNKNSGYVFLSDEDFITGVLEDGKIVEFYSCPQCGNEGTQSDGLENGWDFEKYEGYCTRNCLDQN